MACDAQVRRAKSHSSPDVSSASEGAPESNRRQPQAGRCQTRPGPMRQKGTKVTAVIFPIVVAGDGHGRCQRCRAAMGAGRGNRSCARGCRGRGCSGFAFIGTHNTAGSCPNTARILHHLLGWRALLAQGCVESSSGTKVYLGRRAMTVWVPIANEP